MKVLKKYKKMSVEVKASTAYTVCSILVKCLSLITLPIFTRIMTTEEYGLSTVYASTAAIVVIFTSLRLPYGSLSTAMIKYKNDRIGYLSTVCSVSFIFTIIYFLICVIFKDILVKTLNIPFFLLIFMGIEMLFTSIREAWMGWQRFEYKYKNVVFVTLVTAFISVILSLIFVLNTEQKAIARIISNGVVGIVIGIVIFLALLKKGRKPFNGVYWRFALSFNIPLIPYYLSQVVFNQSDRLMIDSICGRSDAAVYGVAYSLATVLTFIVTSIHSSYTPWIFERIDKNDIGDNRKVSLILSSCIAFMLLGIIALTPEIVNVMAGERYISAIWVVPPISMSVLLLYYSDLFDCILFFYESKFELAFAAIISALINVVLNYIFIPKFGFIAAAYTTLISYLLLAFIDYLFMIRICKCHNLDKNIYNINGLIFIFLIFTCLGFMAMFLYNHPFIRYTIIITVFIFIFIFRSKIIRLFEIVKRK